MSGEGLGPIVVPCVLVNGVPYSLVVDASKYPYVNVAVSALPSGAATAANQALILTELAKKLDTIDLKYLTNKELYVYPHGTPGFQEKFVASASAGVNTLECPAVPAGKVRKLTVVHLSNWSNNATLSILRIHINATSYTLKRVPSLNTNQGLEWSGAVLIGAGHYVSGYLGGCVEGDSLLLSTIYEEFTL